MDDSNFASGPQGAEEFDPQKYLTIIEQVLRFLGLWPRDQDTLLYRAYGAAYLTVCMVLSAIKMLNIKLRWSLLYEIVSDSLYNYKPIIGDVNEFEIMTSQQNSFIRMFKGYCYFIAVGCTAGVLAPCFDGFTSHPMGVWYPGVDVMTTPYYQLQYVLAGMNMCSLVIGTTIYDIIIPAIASYCIGRIQCLHYFFENLHELAIKAIQDDFLSNHRRECAAQVLMCQLLKKGIHEHKAIECIVRKLEHFFWLTIFLQFFCTSVNMCCAGIQVLSVESNLAQLIWIFLYLGCLTIETLLPAWYANMIMEESGKLSFGVYSCNWIGSSPRFLRMMLILQERLKRPLVLDIGIIGNFSLELFASMMTLGYRMFAVMRTLYDSNEV